MTQIKIIEQPILYDGSQLAPHWIYNHHSLLGDSVVAFLGGCDVKAEKMVDWTDRKENKFILSQSMLHFLGEFFEKDLTQTILLQRLLASLIQQEIFFQTKTLIVRGGNDLYDQDAKLSVSIATASPVSTLIHFGINISSHGTPIKTKGLADYGIEPLAFARAILESFRDEIAGVRRDRAKVRAVLP